jgi:restriction system protein
MAIPSYNQFIEPILRFLAENVDGVSAKRTYEYAANALNLTDEDKQKLLSSGMQAVYKNRAGWAHDRLKRAGLSSSPQRGLWKITVNGIAFVQEHPAPFSAEIIEQLTMLKSHSVSDETSSEQATVVSEEAILASPDERLSQALEELRQVAESELQEILFTVSPTSFESIVLDLLYRMGYGVSRADLQRVGSSGDAGIDGVISLDRLGLEKVYVQAKRWQGNVGRPELQAFYGALAGQKAKKGVFITTSTYTEQALSFVKSVEGIVLIDGRRLAGLMIDYELGVTSRTVKIPKIDSDYFDEDSSI